MDTLAALLAGLLDNLRSIGPDVCPGPWAWATTVLGIAVGLLPTVGTVGVALWRKRIGSRYNAAQGTALAAIGVVTCGLLPLLAFSAVGQVFSAAAAGGAVPGLSTAAVRNLGTQVCVAGAQSQYLGAGSVGDAFDPSEPVGLGLAVLLLVVVPIVSTLFVLIQIRTALRRGPAWPSRFFWLPVLALALVTVGSPAGSSEHLWIGVGVGTFLGIVLTAMVGAPRHEVVARSLNPGTAADRGSRWRQDPPAPSSPVPAQRYDAPPPRPVPPPVRPPSTQTRVPPPRTLVAPTAAAGAPVPPPAFPAAAVHRPVRGNRFAPIRRIGAGGFGRVVLAHDAKLGTTVALKAAHAPDDETEERIRREAAALAAVRHPNCVRILDLVHARSDPGLAGLDGMVIVMEYVQGMSLGELVQQRGPLDDVAAARVWAGVAGALHAAHTRGVLHRDVKPGNVIVDPAGVAHLIDFGIARRTGDATLTMAGYVLGTPDYLAPEVAGGKKASPSSDCWQLAATVSYALAGFPPRGGHPDVVSGLRAAAAGAKLSHLPRRSAHLSLLKSAMRNEPTKRPDLPTIQRGLDDWLRRHGGATTGALTAGTGRR
ncbi:serine/threonine-protein kinase [Pseudonocardia sp. N23]|uniref:serine/threonine-protein kinase n=1 Tax=Pseudonocardia sp. N23 TaxID=1987376 RepID=UPI000C0267F6|nr:serine/threonine-protein kinase [Pseudonocardia sp. N23]GAY10765.1 serine/threonine protein kinase [Pseudonocardia sp. N23]